VLIRGLLHLVEERTGLHFPPERRKEFREGILRAQEALGLSDLHALFESLDTEVSGGTAWKRLALELTTGESFFFRDGGQMALIRDVLMAELSRRGARGELLRLWSAGCSRGEEAYSLAILAEEKLPAAEGYQVRVLGTDINPQALEQGRAGRYSAWSFRGVEAGLRARWFRNAGSEFEVVPELKQRVSFREHNLLADPMAPLAEGEGFDLILCRNVFIYFQPQRVKEVLAAFRAVLKPAGALVLGHGEWGAAAPEGMELELHPHSVVLRRADARPSQAPASPRPAPGPPVRSAEARSPVKPAAPRPLPLPELEVLLGKILGLADEGHHEAAMALCKKTLKSHPLSARLHHLRSLLLAERGEWEDCLRALDKALFLDPRLLEAHLDRAHHLEALGRPGEASAAWLAAHRILDDLPEAPLPEGFEREGRDGLRKYIEESLHRCESRRDGMAP
jgi:chemotaxis protein methyltransferase CheR